MQRVWCGSLLFFHRKLRPVKQKHDSRIVPWRKGNMSFKRPAAGEESCKAGSFVLAMISWESQSCELQDG